MSLGSGVFVRNVFLWFLVIVIPAFGLLFWFESANPDGFEWSIEKMYGKPELSGQVSGIMSALKKIQEKTAFLPDYSFRKDKKRIVAKESGKKAVFWPNVETGR